MAKYTNVTLLCKLAVSNFWPKFPRPIAPQWKRHGMEHRRPAAFAPADALRAHVAGQPALSLLARV
jgi:hypothetical protein